MITIFLYRESNSIFNSFATYFSTQALVYAMKSSANTVFQLIQGLKITPVYNLFYVSPKKKSQGLNLVILEAIPKGYLDVQSSG